MNEIKEVDIGEKLKDYLFTPDTFAWDIIKEGKVEELYTLLLMLGAFPPTTIKGPAPSTIPDSHMSYRFEMGSLWMRDREGQYRTVFLPATDTRRATIYLAAIRRCLK